MRKVDEINALSDAPYAVCEGCIMHVMDYTLPFDSRVLRGTSDDRFQSKSNVTLEYKLEIPKFLAKGRRKILSVWR